MPMFSSEMLAQMIRFYGSAQQTIMGQYIEQNVQAFLAIQKKLQEQAKQVYGDKMLLTPELWKQFMQMQAPAMQGMLGNYLEQSARLFMDMQQRMQDQTRGMFSAFPFPGFGGQPPGADEDKNADADLTGGGRAATSTPAARFAAPHQHRVPHRARSDSHGSPRKRPPLRHRA
jgi:polyhydroxyalkanoate synthesis regulator protein